MHIFVMLKLSLSTTIKIKSFQKNHTVLKDPILPCSRTETVLFIVDTESMYGKVFCFFWNGTNPKTEVHVKYNLMAIVA